MIKKIYMLDLLSVQPEKDYELLDSGDGEKLERYGEVVVSRPDPQALWPKQLSEKEWHRAQAHFTRESKNAGWEFRGKVPERWPINFAGLSFYIKPSSFKHTGLFPEQAPNWDFIREQVSRRKGEEVRVLNLFGYTGGASLAAAQAGAKVVHVDGSKVAIGWGRDNAQISGLSEKPIRWILDDAVAFVKREIKRGNKYEGIIMDPPSFGHGPTGEVWKIEEDLMPLFDLCRQLFSENPLFFLVNGYASGYSAIAYKNNIEHVMKDFRGEIELGELTIAEKNSGRLLPCGIFARWSAET